LKDRVRVIIRLVLKFEVSYLVTAVTSIFRFPSSVFDLPFKKRVKTTIWVRVRFKVRARVSDKVTVSLILTLALNPAQYPTFLLPVFWRVSQSTNLASQTY